MVYLYRCAAKRRRRNPQLPVASSLAACRAERERGRNGPGRRRLRPDTTSGTSAPLPFSFQVSVPLTRPRDALGNRTGALVESGLAGRDAGVHELFGTRPGYGVLFPIPLNSWTPLDQINSRGPTTAPDSELASLRRRRNKKELDAWSSPLEIQMATYPHRSGDAGPPC